MKRLVVVRHGQTTWNAEGRIQGQTDSPLSELGREQAARMAPVVAAYEPVAIWSSDLSRAALTADAIAAVAGMTPVRDPRLREVDFGALEGRSHQEYREAYPDRYEALRRGRYDEIPDAERSAAVQARMTQALHDLFDGIEDGRTAVAVSHGGAIKLGVGGLIGLSVDASVEMLWGMDNCGWAVVTDSAGERRLHAYNRVA